MKILVASKNPVKIQAARDAVALMFPGIEIDVEGVPVPSDVSDQPMSDDETRLGAYNRVKNLIAEQSDADLYIGMEGGCGERTNVLGQERLEAFAWMMVSDGKGRWGESRAPNFQLPPAVADLVRQGIELGEADDRVFGKENTKHGEGATGLLTSGALGRAAYYTPAILLALVSFKNKNLY